MKKNDIILVIAVAAYSFLFYLQAAGFNFILFNLILISLLAWKNMEIVKNPSWLIIAAGSLISSLFIFLYGNTLSITSNITSLLLLSAMSFSRDSSLFTGILYSIYSTVASVAFMILDIMDRKKNKPEVKKHNYGQKILLITCGLVIILILFFLYRESNPLFKDFTKDINLDFISIAWIRFTLIGFILLYGFFYHRNVRSLYKYDVSIPSKLANLSEEENQKKRTRKFMSVETEWKSGLILLVLLNFLIIIVNILDALYLWAGNGLPAGVSFSDSVHQSVGTLIFSIIIAICIILFFFRSEMNFYKKNKTLKAFAFLWIVQNIMMVVSTIYRNQIYISEYSLTYKRIGVYAYLILAVAGLISTFIKIKGSRSNWYLFRFNGWSFYLVLLLFSGFNWDKVITRYNISHSKTLDIEYLLYMSDTNIPDLLKLDYDKKLIGYVQSNNLSSGIQADLNERNYYESITYRNYLHYKIYKFLNSYQQYGWKSWCIDKDRVYKEILFLEKEGKIQDIDISGYSLTDISPLFVFSHLKSLDLRKNFVTGLSHLDEFKLLEKLDLSSNNIDNIDSISVSASLKELRISGNPIYDYKALKNFQKLELLDISNNGIIDFKSLPALDKLKYLDISGDQVKDYSSLRKFKSLKTLAISNAKNKNIISMPELEGLQKLDISSNGIYNSDLNLIDKLTSFKNLDELDISQNNISSLSSFRITDKPNSGKDLELLFQNITKLNISNNKLDNLNGLEDLSLLTELNITGNSVSDIGQIKSCTKLTRLFIGSNSIRDISVLADIPDLKLLNISGNPVHDPEILKKLIKLDTLGANNINLTDISMVSEMVNLKSLTLAGNNITDLKPLKKLTKLETLDISNNPVTDFSMIRYLTSLKTLFIPSVSNTIYKELQIMLPNTQIYVNYQLKK
jgi:Leucine-rich repeat (LRR) protein